MHTARTQYYFFGILKTFFSYNHFKENPSEKIVLGKTIIIITSVMQSINGASLKELLLVRCRASMG